MTKLTDAIIFDIKGDMCRLGYLKILTMISDDNENYDIDYHAGLLEEQVTEDEEPKEYLIKPLKDKEKKLSSTAIIPKGVAKNYIELSYGVELFSSYGTGMEDNGNLYHKILLEKNQDGFELDQSLILDPMDKIFLLSIFFEKDNQILLPLIKFFKENPGKISRNDAMIHVTEEILIPEAEKLADESEDEDVTDKVLPNIDTWNYYKEMRDDEPERWKVDGYPFYRHNGNPRLEWLVDLGILEKTSSNFNAGPKISEIYDALLKTKKNDAEPFFEIAKVYLPSLVPALEDEIEKQILDSYKKFLDFGQMTVVKNLLFSLISFELMKNQKITTFEKIQGGLDELVKKYPGKIKFAADNFGNLNFIVIKLSDIR